MIKNSFEKGPEGWHSYDYHASIVAGVNDIFIQTTWQREGGVDNSGYVWANESHWSADVPERPVSILALILYRSWVGEDPVDLREAEVSVYLRGDGLQLFGAQCLFWVAQNGSRWHYSSSPIPISDGCWFPEPTRFTLNSDESLWNHSWAPKSASLDSMLANAPSYGFSFVGFAQEVRGRLSIDEFEIKLRGE